MRIVDDFVQAESNNSISSIQCTVSVGNCEQVHTSVLHRTFQQAKVAGEGKGKTTEWFTCMGGAARCLMRDVLWGSAVGIVAGPPAQGGIQILGGVPLLERMWCYCCRVLG